IFVYNGLSYFLIYIEEMLVNSKFGEFVFTKLRGRTIHGELRATLSKKKGAKKKYRNFNKNSGKRFGRRPIFGLRVSNRKFRGSRMSRMGRPRRKIRRGF